MISFSSFPYSNFAEMQKTHTNRGMITENFCFFQNGKTFRRITSFNCFLFTLWLSLWKIYERESFLILNSHCRVPNFEEALFVIALVHQTMVIKSSYCWQKMGARFKRQLLKLHLFFTVSDNVSFDVNSQVMTYYQWNTFCPRISSAGLFSTYLVKSYLRSGTRLIRCW